MFAPGDECTIVNSVHANFNGMRGHVVSKDDHTYVMAFGNGFLSFIKDELISTVNEMAWALQILSRLKYDDNGNITEGPIKADFDLALAIINTGV